MRRVLAMLAGVMVLAGLGGAGWSTAASASTGPQAIEVTAVFVGVQCQGSDFAAVRLTANVSGETGAVRFRWDWTNNSSFDTPPLHSPKVQHSYSDEQVVTARVGALDSSGEMSSDTVTFTVPSCP